MRGLAPSGGRVGLSPRDPVDEVSDQQIDAHRITREGDVAGAL